MIYIAFQLMKKLLKAEEHSFSNPALNLTPAATERPAIPRASPDPHH